jgi:hypothetical protein
MVILGGSSAIRVIEIAGRRILRRLEKVSRQIQQAPSATRIWREVAAGLAGHQGFELGRG